MSKSVLVLRNKGVKMIAEKPSWIRHEGMQIFSIDVQPGGLRFATGGGDHKIVFLFLMLLSICFVYVVFVRGKEERKEINICEIETPTNKL